LCRYCEATPVKLSSEEADKLAKELEGNKGGGLSSWNKVRSAEGSSHDLFYFFNPKSSSFWQQRRSRFNTTLACECADS
jgi:hypothetical protein